MSRHLATIPWEIPSTFGEKKPHGLNKIGLDGHVDGSDPASVLLSEILLGDAVQLSRDELQCREEGISDDNVQNSVARGRIPKSWCSQVSHFAAGAPQLLDVFSLPPALFKLEQKIQKRIRGPNRGFIVGRRLPAWRSGTRFK